jgi:tripeptide aminopeptidase
MLSKTGELHIRQDDAGNVIARIDPLARRSSATDEVASAPLVLMAHLDTVFTPSTALAATRDGPVVTCPGISDNGRGLAALVTLAEQLQRSDVHRLLGRPVELVATVGEEGEGNLRGARHYFDENDGERRPHAVLVLDGPGDANIVHYAVASQRVRVEYTGPGGHSWADRSAPNPIHAAAQAIADIARTGLPFGAAMTVTRMGGGERLTSVAERAWFDVDLRALHEHVLRDCRVALDAIVGAGDPRLQPTITMLGQRPGGALEWSHPLVHIAARVTEWCGVVPVSAMASTDANIPLSRGIPSIAIGAGGAGGGEHTSAEWYDNTNGPRGIARALGIALSVAAD